MQIRIKAVDTLFFRDGRPFNLGQDSWARGLFPPLPSVFGGMLRTAFMYKEGLAPQEVLSNTKALKINMALLSTGEELLLPLPLDTLVYNGNTTLLKLRRNHQLTSYGLPFLLESDQTGKPDSVKFPFLQSSSFEQYLNGAGQFVIDTVSEKPFTAEPKVGIGIDRSTHIVRESQLYRVDMVRMEGKLKGQSLSFVIDFEGIDVPSNGNIRLGAEGKTISYCEQEKQLSLQLPSITGNVMKLYLATPALFEGGWLPKGLSPDGDTSNWMGEQVQLIAAATGKPIPAGGFDMEARTPKPMYKAVPAGSLYIIKTSDEAAARRLAQKLHGSCISEYDKHKLGFGLCYVGNVGPHQFDEQDFKKLENN